MDSELLLESFREWVNEEALDEVRKKDLKRKYPDQEIVVDAFAERAENKYLPWLMKKWVHKTMFSPENVKDPGTNEHGHFEYLLGLIEKFDLFSRKGALDKLIKAGEIQPKEKDIGYWEGKKIVQFRLLLNKASLVQSASAERKKSKGQTDRIFEDERFFMASPLTHKASCFYGKDTQWCISSKDYPRYWREYTEDKDLFFIFLIDAQPAKWTEFQKVAFVVPIFSPDESAERPDVPEDFIAMAYDAADRELEHFAQLEEAYGADNWKKLWSVMHKYILKRREKESQGRFNKFKMLRDQGWFFVGDIVKLSEEYIARVEKETREAFEKQLVKIGAGKRKTLLDDYEDKEEFYKEYFKFFLPRDQKMFQSFEQPFEHMRMAEGRVSSVHPVYRSPGGEDKSYVVQVAFEIYGGWIGMKKFDQATSDLTLIKPSRDPSYERD